MKNKKIIFGILAVMGAAFLWSLDGVFLRPKFYNYPAGAVVFLEHLLGLIFLSLAGVLLHWRKIFTKNRVWGLSLIKRRTWLALLWVSLFGGLIGTLMITKAFFLAIDGQVTFATVIILQKLQPVFALLMARIILKEKLSGKFYGWAGLAIVASYFLAFGKTGLHLSSLNLTHSAGWFAFLAAFSFGSSTVFGKRLVDALSFSLATVLRFALTVILVGGLLLLDGDFSKITILDGQHWKLLMIIVLSSGAVAMYIYYYGLKRIPASLATIAELFWPLSAIFLDYIINHNVLSFWQGLATGVLLLSFYKIISQQSESKITTKILYQTAGKVIAGKKIGRRLGFPTANIKLTIKIPAGVYGGKAFVDEKKYRAVFFVDEKQKILETHILEFKKDIYGESIAVVLTKRIRGVKKFSDSKSLIKQIEKDIKIIP